MEWLLSGGVDVPVTRTDWDKVVQEAEDFLVGLAERTGIGILAAADWNASQVVGQVALDMSTGRGFVGGAAGVKLQKTSSVVRITTADGLAASTTRYVWRKPDGTFAATATNVAPVSGSVLCSSVVMGVSQSTSINNLPQGRINLDLPQRRAKPTNDALNTLTGNDPCLQALTSLTPTANRAYLSPVRPTDDQLVDTFNWSCGVQSGNYDIGIYDEDGNRLVSLGSTACPAAGSVSAAFAAVQLRAGRLYYLAIVFDNTVARINGVALSSTEQARGLNGNYLHRYYAAQFPLPSTLTLGGGTANTIIPWVALRN
jgi:hypothetical protein